MSDAAPSPPVGPDPLAPPSSPPSKPTMAGAPRAPERRRTDRRAGEDRRHRQVPVAVERRSGLDRRVLDRRASQAGKTAGGYDLDADTLEFIHAVSQFKAATGKPFPTWSEILEIVRGLGYRKRSP